MAAENPNLLVEGNPDEETLTLRAMQGYQGKASVAVAHDGVVAMDYLFAAEGQVEAKKMLRFVNLDLMLPRVEGFDAVARVRPLPVAVAVFSSSSERQHLRRCRHLGANGHVVKPVAAGPYPQTVARMAQYRPDLNLDGSLRP